MNLASITGVARRVTGRREWPVFSGLGLAAAALAEAAVRGLPDDTSDTTTLLVCTLLMTVPLAARRRYLAAATTVITLATVGLLSTGLEPPLLALAGQAWILYLAAASYRRTIAVALGLPFAVNAVAPFDSSTAGTASILLFAVMLACLAVGDARRERRKTLTERDDARNVAAQSLRDQAVLAERTRIARDLHDVVAHHLSVIAVQAATARLTTADLPEPGRRQFAEIGATAREALTQMRRLLGVLRTEEDHSASRHPQAGLDRLDELLDAARAHGTPVQLILTGHRQPLPAGVDVSAYRIVQEALTNARRHAPGAPVDIQLDYGPQALQLTIRDHGDPEATTTEGLGILGMRERATLAGGRLTAGPAPDGGYQVTAELPTGDQT